MKLNIYLISIFFLFSLQKKIFFINNLTFPIQRLNREQDKINVMKQIKRKIYKPLNIAVSLLIISFFIILLYLTGIDNFKILFYSKHSYRLSLTLSISLLIVILNIIALSFPAKIFTKKFIPLFINLINIFLITTLLSLGIYFKFKYREVIRGKKPNAFEKYRYKAGPFIQLGPFENRTAKSPENSMVIWWFTPEKMDKTAYIKYGTSPDPNRMKTEIETLNGDGRKHVVELMNLSPSTTYYYSIPDFDNTIYSFSTAPNEKNREAFHILCTGDVRNHGKDTLSLYKIINESADLLYNGMNIRPSFKIILGDLIYNGRDMKSWNLYFSSEKMHSSIYPGITVFGNHEFYADYGGNFNYFFPQPRYFSFDYSNAHFIFIHNYDGLLRSTGKKQYEFIKEDLKKNYNKKWIIVAIHEPLLSTGDYNMNKILIAQYFQLFRKYKVDMVLAGHDHHYDSFHTDKNTKWGGTLYIVNGGGGARVDAYLLNRKSKKWKKWYHDRNSEYGLYQNDKYTVNYHIYGEISWGFMDIEISKEEIKSTYYRVIDIERYFEETGQDIKSLEIITDIAPSYQKVHTVSKERSFK